MIEMFVFLNPQTLGKFVNDQFVITFSKDYSIHIPISVNHPGRHLARVRKSSSYLIKSKENSRIPISKKKLGLRAERRKNCMSTSSK